MAKTEVIDFRAFMRNDYEKPAKQVGLAAGAGALTAAIITPVKVLAATDAFTKVWPALMHIGDWACVAIIVFAGFTWMFGNRSKAIEFLIGGGSGYILMRHAIDVRDFLAGI